MLLLAQAVNYMQSTCMALIPSGLTRLPVPALTLPALPGLPGKLQQPLINAPPVNSLLATWLMTMHEDAVALDDVRDKTRENGLNILR
jgi:hypothetical protein